MSTAHKILNLLNREDLSVSELAAHLRISRNSAHVQVAKLEAAGAVQKVRRQAAKRVGKPAFGYRTVAHHEDTYSLAYKPVLGSLLEAMGARLSAEDRVHLLEEAGRRLAAASGLAPTSDFSGDLERALESVNDLGAMAEVCREEGVPTVRCHSCPVASMVHQDASTCSLVASFFSEATGTPVAVRCRRDETVVCGFSFDTAKSIHSETGAKGGSEEEVLAQETG